MSTTTPLAHQVRPKDLPEFVGQQHLLEEQSALRHALQGHTLFSMIFWGPPGTGKTTLASMLAYKHQADFVSLSAVNCGVKEIRQVVEAAAQSRAHLDRQTILFLDEVHRFNKSQQDAFLPHIENGTIIFVGATTENPSFALNNALLSRVKLYVLKPLSEQELVVILERVCCQYATTSSLESTLKSQLQSRHLKTIARAADGDARRAIGMLEMLLQAVDQVTDHATDQAIGNNAANVDELMNHVTTGTARRFDRDGDEFYDQISALHKSVRGSDPDAALYWLCRMLDGGCDPRYLLRRLLRMASEDIGNADPRALWLVSDCSRVYERLGSPEGDLAIAQAAVYLSCAPKSNAVYCAFKTAMGDAKKHGSLSVPERLRNAPTALAKSMGHGKEYRYAHDYPGGYVPAQHYFPDDMSVQTYYHPVARGLETKIAQRLQELRQWDKQHRQQDK